MKTREEAVALLYEYTKSDSLRKHGLGVEAVMRAYARKYDEDEEVWGIVGLLHDFDYEIHPTADKHPMEGSKILRERGYPEEVIYAIQCHADYLGLERKTNMDKAIFACDELAGLVTAVALVRPSKSVMDVKVKSVKKKMKDKSFARGVLREDIINGTAQLGVDIDEHIATVIEAMQGVASDLGLGLPAAGAGET
ncbi:MAG: HDIG domain-containing protein [Chloroflexi bacterium]|nr:HDIG domain-containing protein [Chloroflexota bacterium]